MKGILQFVALTVVIALGTWWGGWWMVPLAAAAYGAWRAAQRTVVFTAMVAGASAWGVLLVYDGAAGPVGRLSQLFGNVFRLSSGTLLMVTLAYAALLAASAAALARGIRRLMTPV